MGSEMCIRDSYLLERTLEEAAIGDLVELELFVTSGDGQKASACWQAS